LTARRVSLCAAAVAVAAAGAAGAAPTSVALHASAPQIDFGDPVTLAGRAPAHVVVQLLSQPCGFKGQVQVAAKTAQAGGTFAFKVEPTLRTTFWVRAGKVRSRGVTVRVRPAVAVQSVGPRAFAVTVSVGAGHFFNGAKVVLEARSKPSQAWRPVGSGLLTQASPVDALVAVSKTTVAAKIAAGSEVRAQLRAPAAGACFLPSVSPPIRA